MTTYRILDCKAGRCEAFGEVDLPDGDRAAVMKSPDGDFAVTLTPMYVNDGDGKGGRVEWSIGAQGKTKEAWQRVQGFRAALAGLIRRLRR